MCLRVYGIVLLMCPDELDKQDALAEQDLADESVFVSADVEDDSRPLRMLALRYWALICCGVCLSVILSIHVQP